MQLRVPVYRESLWYMYVVNVNAQKCIFINRHMAGAQVNLYRFSKVQTGYHSFCTSDLTAKTSKPFRKSRPRWRNRPFETQLSHVYMYVRLKDNSSLTIYNKIVLLL